MNNPVKDKEFNLHDEKTVAQDLRNIANLTPFFDKPVIAKTLSEEYKIIGKKNTDASATGKWGMVKGKAKEEFRNYKDSYRQKVVENHYRLMRTKHTVAFSNKMESKWLSFDRCQMTIAEAFNALEGYVDSSDPDSSLFNFEHMLQTAEAIRKSGYPDWFQLVGLLHDMGKIQYLWGNYEDGQVGTADGPQWSLGGDTWVVGCRIPDCVVFPEFNKLNPDMADPRYNSETGLYKESCGIDNLRFTWGHDEYMYQMLKYNKSTIPKTGLDIIRFHSCYPWHTGGAYRKLMKEGDEETLEWVRTFNEFDLYTKADERPEPNKLWPYYQSLIDRYCPGKLWW